MTTSVEEVTADAVKRATEVELDMEPEDVTALLESHDRIFNGWGISFYGWAKEVASWARTPGEDVKIVEMTTKSVEYYINLADKAVARFERIDPKF